MNKAITSRRTFLKGSTLLAGYAMAGPVWSGAGDQAVGKATAKVGYWKTDSAGLPVFRYVARPYAPGYAIKKDVTLEDDPYFLLGNYRLTAFVHSSGVVRLMTAERAWARLNDGADARPGNRARLVVKTATGESSIDLIGASGIARNPQDCQRDFGIGYADFIYATDKVNCRRTISVEPSKAINTGLSAYLVEIEINNNAAEERTFSYEESVLARYSPSVERGGPESQWPTHYTCSVAQAPELGLISCQFAAQLKDPSRRTPDGQASRNDLSPPGLFIQAPRELNQGIAFELLTSDAEQSGKFIGVRFSVKIPAGKKITARFVIGLQNDAQTPDLSSLIAAVTARRSEVSPFLASWRAVLPDFSREKNAALRGEMVWNAYVLEAMATYSAFYKETYIPQGMTYDYTLGVTAAPRDHLQHALPLCYTNPALAKSAIRFVLKKMTYQGEIKYTDLGYGRTSNSAWNTSDQQLYLFLGIAEYLRVTKDVGFLEEQTEFLPMEAKYSGSTLEKLRRAFGYLRDEVGTGPHGLIRLMNSDWNDMIYVETPVMQHFFSAESHMNSAMALCLLPALIAQLETSLPKLQSTNQKICRDLVEGMRQFDKANRAAFYKDLGQRGFSRRLYLAGESAMGDQDMHIEPQIFLMQDPEFPRARKQLLWREIQDRLLRNEKLGPRQREHGVASTKYGPGTCENGGLWNALTGPLVIGLAGFDKKSAADLLNRMTFSHFAKCYPDYWVGQWTAPDTINTFESGDIAGLPRPGDNGLWFKFAAYCAHAHAWPLYAYLRLAKDDVAKA